MSRGSNTQHHAFTALAATTVVFLAGGRNEAEWWRAAPVQATVQCVRAVATAWTGRGVAGDADEASARRGGT